ncbi:hypothetical protein NXW94_23685 [Bacteroides ovatus]|nr:hypothetical protein [Bacteroides ovatus]
MHEDAITRLVNKAEETQADMVVAPFMFCYDGESHKSTFFNFVELSGVEFFEKYSFKKGLLVCMVQNFIFDHYIRMR